MDMAPRLWQRPTMGSGTGRDYYSYIAADGKEYFFSAGLTRWVMAVEGEGMPDKSFVVDRGLFQHGVTLRGYTLEPRLVRLRVRHNSSSRDSYRAARAYILDRLSPNRVDYEPMGVLRKRWTTSAGVHHVRDLGVILQEGLRFEPREEGVWDEWGFTETLDFYAPNPIWYDPVVHEETGLFVSFPTFPMTFPVVFRTYEGTLDVDYAGTFQEYPTIILDGPLTDPTIENATTGQRISLDVDLPAGQQIWIVLTYERKRILLNPGSDGSGGSSLIGRVVEGSDLASFHLRRAAVNEILFRSQSTGTGSQVTFRWQSRYIGI